MSDKILVCRFPRPDANVKLFCFPWAGGGANFYSNWGKVLPDTLEVHGVCLAGRESRFNDPVYTNLQQLLDDVTSAIHSMCLGKTFALWGHSMGAHLAYEAAFLLKKRYKMEPVHMFLSGTSAPHSEKRKQNLLDVRSTTDDEFIQILKRFGGTPVEIIDNRELMAIFLPPLRADYELRPQFNADPPSSRCVLSCSVDVFDGRQDSEHDLQGWKDMTTGAFSVTMLDGGHFYLKEEANTAILCSCIKYALDECPL